MIKVMLRANIVGILINDKDKFTIILFSAIIYKSFDK